MQQHSSFPPVPPSQHRNEVNHPSIPTSMSAYANNYPANNASSYLNHTGNYAAPVMNGVGVSGSGSGSGSGHGTGNPLERNSSSIASLHIVNNNKGMYTSPVPSFPNHQNSNLSPHPSNNNNNNNDSSGNPNQPPIQSEHMHNNMSTPMKNVNKGSSANMPPITSYNPLPMNMNMNMNMPPQNGGPRYQQPPFTNTNMTPLAHSYHQSSNGNEIPPNTITLPANGNNMAKPTTGGALTKDFYSVKKGCKKPDFLLKLCRILQTEDPQIISWDSGRIYVRSPDLLENRILPKYFRHNKYSSFQRQLNYFGFRKTSGKGKMNACMYTNYDLKDASLKQLLRIRRKTNTQAIEYDSDSDFENDMDFKHPQHQQQPLNYPQYPYYPQQQQQHHHHQQQQQQQPQPQQQQQQPQQQPQQQQFAYPPRGTPMASSLPMNNFGNHSYTGYRPQSNTGGLGGQPISQYSNLQQNENSHCLSPQINQAQSQQHMNGGNPNANLNTQQYVLPSQNAMSGQQPNLIQNAPFPSNVQPNSQPQNPHQQDYTLSPTMNNYYQQQQGQGLPQQKIQEVKEEIKLNNFSSSSSNLTNTQPLVVSNPPVQTVPNTPNTVRNSSSSTPSHNSDCSHSFSQQSPIYEQQGEGTKAYNQQKLLSPSSTSAPGSTLTPNSANCIPPNVSQSSISGEETKYAPESRNLSIAENKFQTQNQSSSKEPVANRMMMLAMAAEDEDKDLQK